MIDKIYAYGDSFTAGDGVNAVDAWPAQLGKLLNKPAINRGIPGGSNKLSIINLLNDFLEIESNENPAVIFSWTGISRTAVYLDEKKKWENILPGHDPYEPVLKEKKQVWYAHVYNDYEGLMDYYSQQIFVASFLTSKNIPFTFINSFIEDYIAKESFDIQYKNIVNLLPIDKFVLGHKKSIYQHYCIERDMKCHDGYHPSELAHLEVANKIKCFLESEYVI